MAVVVLVWSMEVLMLLTNAIHSNGYAYNVLVQLSDKCCPFIIIIRGIRFSFVAATKELENPKKKKK